MMDHATNDSGLGSNPWTHPALRFLLWAIGGGIIGYFGGKAVAENKLLGTHDATLEAWFEMVGWPGFAGLMVAALLLLLGIYLSVLTLLPDAVVARAMKADADEAMARPRKMLRVAGAGAIGYAVLVGIFVFPGIDPTLGLLIGSGAFLIVTALFIRGMQLSDELERAAQNEAMSWSFVIVEAAVVGWALLHHFDYIGPIDPLAAVLAVTLVYYAAAVVASVRRGMVR